MPQIDPQDQRHAHPQREDQKRILRDYLAYDRTVMANDRSLLAFARTGLTSIVTGLAFLKFITADWAQSVGWALIAAGPVIIIAGVWRFVQFRRRYYHEMDELPE